MPIRMHPMQQVKAKRKRRRPCAWEPTDPSPPCCCPLHWPCEWAEEQGSRPACLGHVHGATHTDRHSSTRSQAFVVQEAPVSAIPSGPRVRMTAARGDRVGARGKSSQALLLVPRTSLPSPLLSSLLFCLFALRCSAAPPLRSPPCTARAGKALENSGSKEGSWIKM